jgi:hypothetical protein
MIENSLGVPEPDDWHMEAALVLRKALRERGELSNIRKAVRNEDFWKWQHFSTGMGVRNFLRTNGYDEKTLNIWNLDDHYIPIMLLAVGYEVIGGYSNKNLGSMPSRLQKISDPK